MKLPFTFALCAFVFAMAASGQQPTPTPDDTIRIDTSLVQVPVTVTDKNGRFVKGLKLPELRLRIGGKPADIEFLEEVSTGTRREKQLRPGSDIASGASTNRDQSGRVIVFFLDDLHLSLDSIKRTRDMLRGFIDKQMRDSDLVAIATAKGTVGFLQQFTSNRDVLRAAIDRIAYVPYVVDNTGVMLAGAPMTEYNALTIERRDDPQLYDFYVSDCVRRTPTIRDRRIAAMVREQCGIEVRNRARSIVIQAGAITDATYISLEHLLETAARMAGSKLAFFISDGFLADSGARGRVSADRVIAVAKKARQSGIVIYSIDARGTVSGLPDATGAAPMDPDGRLASANLRAIAASQDAMNALAVDTGGRALRNQNYFDDFVTGAIAETSQYYLVAWRPENDDPKQEWTKNVEVRVEGRPELVVREGKGSFRRQDATAAVSKPLATARSDSELKNALSDALSVGGMPIDLSAVYLDVPGNGVVVTSSVQVPSAYLSFGPQRNEPASVTVAGVVLDEHGKPAASFGTGLKVDPPKTGGSDTSGVIYNHPSPLKPGIYQIRVVARDDKSGVLGSASEWVIVPDLAGKTLSMSSLLLDIKSAVHGGTIRTQWSIDHRFLPRRKLRFMGFVYNAVVAPNGQTDLIGSVMIKRDGVEIGTSTSKKVILEKGADIARIPVTDEIDLHSLTPGRYELEITVDDRFAQKRATRSTTFYIQ